LNIIKIKAKLKKAIFESLEKIDEIISITFVGSFIDRKDLSGISDIDVVVICKSLNKNLFNKCINKVQNINLEKCGIMNHELLINSTFGPLKYDKPNLVVVHLMIYDIGRHKRHTLNSPFTCFDWERSKVRIGLSLKKVFPVGILQYRDFKEARRSLKNYINDLNNNIVSYREYSFKNGKVYEKILKKELDERHVGEYSYHIVKYLTSNYLKLLNKKNEIYKHHSIMREIKRLIPKNGTWYAEKFHSIYKIKNRRTDQFPQYTKNWILEFLKEFQNNIDNEWNNSIKIKFLRHYKTKLNNKTFLGQGRDPNIIKRNIQNSEKMVVDKIYSSPMRRCIDTAKILCNINDIIIDDRLSEFNYGQAEGLSYNELKEKFPYMIEEWSKNKDPKFPSGENTINVFNRLTSFLNDLKKDLTNNNYKSVCIITHNGILRCMIGHSFNFKIHNWHKINIKHGEVLDYLYYKKEYFPDIPRNYLATFLKNYKI